MTTTTLLRVRITDGVCTRETNVQVVINKVVVGSYLFAQPLFQSAINEDQSVPHVVRTFANTKHSATYTIVGGSTYFNINSTTGKNYLLVFTLVTAI